MTHSDGRYGCIPVYWDEDLAKMSKEELEKHKEELWEYFKCVDAHLEVKKKVLHQKYKGLPPLFDKK